MPVPHKDTDIGSNPVWLIFNIGSYNSVGRVICCGQISHEFKSH